MHFTLKKSPSAKGKHKTSSKTWIIEQHNGYKKAMEKPLLKRKFLGHVLQTWKKCDGAAGQPRWGRSWNIWSSTLINVLIPRTWVAEWRWLCESVCMGLCRAFKKNQVPAFLTGKGNFSWRWENDLSRFKTQWQDNPCTALSTHSRCPCVCPCGRGGSRLEGIKNHKQEQRNRKSWLFFQKLKKIIVSSVSTLIQICFWY